jgi:hypothetical protein
LRTFGRWVRRHPRISVGLAVCVAAVVVLGQASSASTKHDAGSSLSATPSAPTTPTTSSAATSAATSAAAHATPTSAAPSAGENAALALLATIAVKGRAPKTGYTRDAFGPAWTDDNNDPSGHNGCDTRNDVLRRDLTQVVLKADSNGCTVLTGTLHDPYTGIVIAFQRGTDTSSAVQIDHVVALSDAWQTGAQYWSASKRVDLANDPLELLAVDGPSNESKGDGDAATWLPPNKSFRCAYVARQVAVKARYRLWVTPAEHDATARVLSSCPSQAAPHETGPPAAGTTTTHPTSHPTTAARLPILPTSSAVYYANCAAVRAAGQAPLLRGQPGYRSGLDRDGDGVACE